MKLGILTFHRAHNYGAVLQTYALQQCLQSMGHDVWVIDYRQSYIEKVYRTFKCKYFLKTLLKRPYDAGSYVKRTPRRIRSKHHFLNFLAHHLHLTAPCKGDNIPQDFDAYVIGSDQLWNPECTDHLLDPVYLGHFPRHEGTRLYGYAISAKLYAIDLLGEEDLPALLNSFAALSLREQTFAKVIEHLTGARLPICCDPTLLTEPSTWETLTNDKFKNRRYVLTYRVRGDGKYLRAKAEALASQLQCEIIDASTLEYSVEDFVSLFRYAQYVITTSFHGTAFSLIFSRPLYGIKLHDGRDARYAELLHTLGADQLCVDPDFDPIPREVNYAPIQSALANYRQRSLAFLRKIG